MHQRETKSNNMKRKKILSKFLHLSVRNHLGLHYVTKFHSGEMMRLVCSSNLHISFTKDNDKNIKSKINTTVTDSSRPNA